ncbi:hypothetical protein Tco_1266844 [Tanacetum coccineum]
MAESLCNKFKGGKCRIMPVQEIKEMLQVHGQIMQVVKQELLNAIIFKVKDTWLGNALSLRGQGTHHDAYDSDCNDISSAKAVLMANLSNYGSDILFEVPKFETYQNDMDDESVQAMQHFKQTPVDEYPDNEITSDSNIIPKESKEKESKYMDKEIDLEKKIKYLDNIVYKVGQSVQIVHMLTKPQVFYDDTHKQALGYQNPFYLKKAQRIKPTLYDGSVISRKHDVIPMTDEEETLILEEVSRSKMLAKQNDPISKEKKINTTLINYVELNHLFKDFGKHYVPQQELSAEQAFWLQTSDHNTDQSKISPAKIEAPKELPKCSVDKQCFEIHKKELFLDNDQVLHQIMSQDVMLCVMNSTAVFGDYVNLEMKKSESCIKCLDLEAELVKKKNMVERDDNSCENQNALEFSEYFENNDLKAQLQEKDTTINKLRNHIKSLRESDKKDIVKHDMDEIETINIELEHNQFDSIKKTRALSKEHSDSLIAQLNSKSIENSNLKGQIQEKIFVTTTLQNELRRLKGKNVLDNASTITNVTTIAPGILTKSNEKLVAITPKNNDKKVRVLCSTSASGSKPTGNTKNNRISQSSSSNKTNKVEDQSRSITSRKNKKNRVAKTECKAYVIQSMLNANFKPVCAICNECLFDANHDKCVPNFVQDVNVHSKSKSTKSYKKQNIWKPTGKVFTEIGYRWKPTRRTFTLVGNSCPLTRFTSTKVVHLKETTSKSVETQKPEIKVYSRKPKPIKSVGSSSKSTIEKSRITNTTEPNQSWGSNASDVQSSSSLVDFRLSRLFSGTVRFGNDQIAKILGNGDYQLGNITISQVYYVEGLGHNLFFIKQFCDSNLEVAVDKNNA